MTFVSYAQNMEDVILWRLFKEIPSGFYIDVGANDPTIDSVTRAFYERGWQGINLEPVENWYDKLVRERPRDINLRIAAGAETGKLLFYDIPGTGLSTLDESIAKRHQVETGSELVISTVDVRTLNDVCSSFSAEHVHFLKVDVEGTEKDVLLGLDLEKVRPWIILVESTLPNTQVESYEEWEHLLTSAEYKFVYFDGLNRYYLAREYSHKETSFRVQPNYFDDFVFAESVHFCDPARVHAEQAEAGLKNAISEWNLERSNWEQQHKNWEIEVSRWEKQYSNWEKERAESQIEMSRLNAALQAAEQSLVIRGNQLNAVYASYSWRITYPFRRLLDAIGSPSVNLKELPKTLLKAFFYPLRLLLQTMLHFIGQRPRLAATILSTLKRFPRLDDSVHALYRQYREKTERPRDHVGTGTLQATSYGEKGPASMSAHSRQIYMKLSVEIQKRKRAKV